MKNICKVLIALILLMFRCISIISFPKLRILFGKMIGGMLFVFWKSRRNIAIENITYSFPEKSKTEVKTIAKESFKSIAITFFELFALNSFNENKLHNMIDFNEGLELINKTTTEKIIIENTTTEKIIIENITTEKQGMLFVSGHFGNWELIAYAVGIFTKLPITIIVKPQANEIVDKELNKIRTAAGNKIVSMYHAARVIVKEIRTGGTIALLADQSATENADVFVDFLGRPASTYKVVAELALRYRVPLIMGFAVRQPNGKYKAELTEINYTDLDFTQENILELTKRHTNHLENAIRQYPEQWAWMHKRWKHNPQKI